VVSWVTSLSVGLGSIVGLTAFMSCIRANKRRFEEGVWGDVCDVSSPKLDNFVVRPKDRRW
jgi:hypothetical protein